MRIHISWEQRVFCSDAGIIRSYTRFHKMTRYITDPTANKIVTKTNTCYIYFCINLHKTVNSTTITKYEYK
jgi:hypothetical protein